MGSTVESRQRNKIGERKSKAGFIMRKHSEVLCSRNKVSKVENSHEQRTVFKLEAMVYMIFGAKFSGLFNNLDWLDSLLCISHK